MTDPEPTTPDPDERDDAPDQPDAETRHIEDEAEPFGDNFA